MVVALIALFVATAGTATATTAFVITGAQIKNGSIGLADLSAKAKRALKGQRGPRGYTGAPGAQGAQGAPGAQGANGANGGFDPAKVSYVAGTPVDIAPGNEATVIANCPAGTKVIGGGFSSDVWHGANPFGSLYMTDQGPLSSGLGWFAYLYNSASAPDDATVNAYAVCAAK
jgi:hypothetical protein